MNSKRGKVCKTSAVDEGDEDSLKIFPEPILSHILSFLPTKHAARTSILSKFWRYFFLNVPKLVFCDEHKLSDDFIEFVYRRLVLCKTKTSITDFQLKLTSLPPSYVINSWILILLSCNLKVLQIIEELREAVDAGTPQCLPREIFGWESLVSLKLGGEKMVLKFPKFVKFPNLSILDLERLEIQQLSKYIRFDHESYPLLKNLRLTWVRFNYIKDNEAYLGVEIFLCTLETLEFMVDEQRWERIDINTPHLQQLNFKIWEVNEDFPVQISFCKSDVLISADLYSSFNSSLFHTQLLGKTNGVKDLKLSEFDAQKYHPEVLPDFSNLTHLDLSNTEVKSMLSLLRSAPNLKVLVVDQMVQGEDDEYFVSPADVPLCLAQKLKHVRMSKFSSSSDVKYVRLFLQYGAVLERMTLEKSRWSSVSTVEQLLKLPRCSPKCEIELLRVRTW